MLLSEIQIRDPYIVTDKEAGAYYLFGSTDRDIWNEGTGFDAYVSRDLEHWEGPHPVFRPEPDFFAEKNFWAPEVHVYQGRYYMFATFRRKDNGLLGTAILDADHILGPYRSRSQGPVTPEDWSSLDGTLYVDEQQQPWMVFCREWQQIGDGTICAMPLDHDLTAAAGEPVTLFHASAAPWATPFYAERYPGRENFVTDGPFLFRNEDRLCLIWASFIDNRYALGLAVSESGTLQGPWTHEDTPLYGSDGGHGMIFETTEGEKMLALHTPNRTPYERTILIPLASLLGIE
ncbi:glycoside hydrolase family 43 protein [Saccharibacillus endophyticus]|uniref:Glycosyl hydrolase family 43 n=1 Tax=Saccharibacillus endophyticus TaxID=2060666 RepID=A0ABQ1ZIR6_9BACL|nr:glycoside hydrolase family 43 protein [Saccharibacillus endophyticus]GGH68264.1 glycosyl hydrolase family 43 [Saccharibacillus endophyticus]